MKLRDQMPELDGATAWLNGKRTREQLVGGKPTLIHFWSVSCIQCKEELGRINEFKNRFGNDLNLVAVHMPRVETDLNMTTISEVAATYNITHPIYIDSDVVLTDRIDNEYVPAYYVFDKDGQLRHFQAGGGGIKMLIKRIARLIDEMKRK